MASNIVPGNIDGDFPVAGIDNDSQGFRDNFTNTSTNFTEAKAELEDLQTKVVLKSPLIGESVVDNDMLGEVIKAPTLLDARETIYTHSTVSGSVDVDHQNGHYQTLTTTGPITLAFSNFPGTPGTPVLGRVRLEMDIQDVAHTVTFPGSVTNGVSFIDGYSGGVVTFTATGVFVFEFYTIDSATFTVNDITRQSAPASAGIFNVVEDVTPQLGGPLDVDGNNIVSTAGDITLAPVGGNVAIESDLDVQANSITTTTVNGGITLTPNGTGDVTLGSFIFDADQTVGASEDGYIFEYDFAAGKISLQEKSYVTPTATTAELEDVADAINTTTLKVAGYMVFNTSTNKPVWAAGAGDGDVWVNATGATDHTPV